MDSEAVIAAVSLIIFLLCQTGGFMYYAGKLSQKVSGDGDDLLNLRADVSGLGKKVESNRKASFVDFVTHVECNGISAQRDIRDEQNAKEHSELKDMVGDTNEKLDAIFECLHKLDKRVPDAKRTG
jgi:hypothetical protein